VQGLSFPIKLAFAVEFHQLSFPAGRVVVMLTGSWLFSVLLRKVFLKKKLPI